MIRLNDDEVFVSIFRGSRSLIVEIITEDSEALDLSEVLISKVFKEAGLKFKDTGDLKRPCPFKEMFCMDCDFYEKDRAGCELNFFKGKAIGRMRK